MQHTPHRPAPAMRSAVGPLVLMLLLLSAGGCATTSTKPTASTPPETTQSSPGDQTYDSAKVVSATKVVRTSKGSNVVSTARSLIGTPYKWGGRSPKTGFDCSGFVWYVFNEYGVELPRTSGEMLTAGYPVTEASIRPGDILIYNIGSRRRSLHAAIATGRGTFVHSPSSGKTVSEVSMSDDYWQGRLIGARRIF